MNYLKAHPGKSQLLRTSNDEASIKVEDTNIKSSSSKNLWGVIIDNKLTFNKHVSKLCKKASNNYMLWLGFQNIWLKTNLEL